MIWVHQARGRRGISTIHSTEYGRCGNQFYDGQSGRIRFQESAGTHWADRVITVSRALKQEVQWMYTVPDGKVSVVYNGVNARNYEGWINPGEVKRRYAIGAMDPMVLFVGRLAHQKGPDLLMEAIPPILKFHSLAKFLFAGDGELRKALETPISTIRNSAGDTVYRVVQWHPWRPL